MKFKQFLGECDSKEWISPRQNNGEFDYWLVLRVTDLSSIHDSFDEGFISELSVVAPSQLSEGKIESAFRSMNPEADRDNVLNCLEALYEYGYRVTVWSTQQESALVAMYRGVMQAEIVESLFGDYMDKPVNGIGTTGWKLIRGEL